MDHKSINDGIDRAANSAKETIDLIADRIDAASRCAREKHVQVENRMKEKILHATDVVEQQVEVAADKVREKIRKSK